MKNYLSVYLRMFFGMLPLLLPIGIIFGVSALCISPIILLSVFQSSPESLELVPRISILTFLGSIVLFSGFFSLTAGTLHIISVNNGPYSNVDGAMNVRHKRNLNLQKSYDEAFDLCLTSLASIENHSIKTAIREQGEISANARMSWKTWSDKITFRLRKMSENQTKIEIYSRPSIPTTLIDYGKNLENIERICAFLTDPQT